MKHSVHLVKFIISSLYHLKHILEVSVIRKSFLHTSGIFLIQIRDRQIILGILGLFGVVPFIRAWHPVRRIPLIRARHSVHIPGIIPCVWTRHSLRNVPCVRARHSFHIPGIIPCVWTRHSLRRIPRIRARYSLHISGVVPLIWARHSVHIPGVVPCIWARYSVHISGVVPCIRARHSLRDILTIFSHNVR